jgi:exosortase H (IPTLxxWG-CTERM-specific)
MSTFPHAAETKRRPLDQRGELVKFVAWFLVILAGSSLLMELPWVQLHLFQPHLRHVARWSAALLRLCTVDCTAQDAAIINTRFTIRIVKGCDSIYPTLLLCSAMFGYPSSWMRKIAGGVAGAVILYLLNIVRIGTLFAVGMFAPRAFEVVHLYVWQALFIVITLCMWLLWIVAGDRLARRSRHA